MSVNIVMFCKFLEFYNCFSAAHSQIMCLNVCKMTCGRMAKCAGFLRLPVRYVDKQTMALRGNRMSQVVLFIIISCDCLHTLLPAVDCFIVDFMVFIWSGCFYRCQLCRLNLMTSLLYEILSIFVSAVLSFGNVFRSVRRAVTIRMSDRYMTMGAGRGKRSNGGNVLRYTGHTDLIARCDHVMAFGFI